MSTRPATDATHGPLRDVVEVKVIETGYRAETLSCGHLGRVLRHGQDPGKRRRCEWCLVEADPDAIRRQAVSWL